MAAPTRWETNTKEGHSQWYVERFRTKAADGEDLVGEARLVDAMAKPASRILDAGCGTGRVGAELQRRGHTVVGVDADPVLIAAAEVDNPGPDWRVADLSELELEQTEPFDVAVVAGNVMAFVAPDTETDVLRRIAAHLKPGGFILVGLGTGRDLSLKDFDAAVANAELTIEQRFGTWDLRPWTEASDFAVTVLRT